LEAYLQFSTISAHIGAAFWSYPESRDCYVPKILAASKTLEKIDLDSKVSCINDVQCMVEIGSSFGLSKLVTGKIGKVKDSWFISLKLIDTRGAEVVNRVLESFEGSSGELKYALKLGVYKLTGVEYSGRTGSIDIGLNVKDAKLTLAGREERAEESFFRKDNMLPGRYNLKVIPDDEEYYPLQTDIYISPGAVNVKKIVLAEKPVPWYKSPLFWTVAGTIITAAAVTTVYIYVSNPEPAGGETVSP